MAITELVSIFVNYEVRTMVYILFILLIIGFLILSGKIDKKYVDLVSKLNNTIEKQNSVNSLILTNQDNIQKTFIIIFENQQSTVNVLETIINSKITLKRGIT